MNSKLKLFGCRKCFQKFKLLDLSDSMQLCQTCQTSNTSNSYKQCNYCKGDYKNTIPDDICSKCKNQLEKHGEPSNCSICKLKMVFGNAVICVRCSHYRSKFGDARECCNCCQMSAFYKDNISREKVDGKILCWMCTYYYKVLKSKMSKNNRITSKRSIGSNSLLVEIPPTELPVSPNEGADISRTTSTNSLLSAEPINKRSRIEEESSLLMYNHDSTYNEHLMKVNTLQEDIKQFRRRIITKDSELMAKDNQITGLKADLLQKDKDFADRMIAMKGRWENERQALTEKIRTLQRENVNIQKSGKKRRPVDIGLQYLTKNPLTRAPPCVTDSPEVVQGVVSKNASSAEDSPV